MKPYHFITVALIMPALAVGGRAADKAPGEKTGLPVGTKAPPFTLKDQSGKDRTLDESLKKGRVALIFYRSAGW